MRQEVFDELLESVSEGAEVLSSMKQKPVDIGEIFREGTLVDNAVSEAVKDALRRHKKLGQSIVAWQDGRVVHIPPEEIDVEDKAEERDDT